MNQISEQDNILNKAKLVKKSYVKMFLCGAAVTVAGILVSKILNSLGACSVLCVTIFKYLGYICWSATLGVLGWEIQTWSGNIPPEMLNKKIAQIFSLIGIFLFVASVHKVEINTPKWAPVYLDFMGMFMARKSALLIGYGLAPPVPGPRRVH